LAKIVASDVTLFEKIVSLMENDDYTSRKFSWLPEFFGLIIENVPIKMLPVYLKYMHRDMKILIANAEALACAKMLSSATEDFDILKELSGTITSQSIILSLMEEHPKIFALYATSLRTAKTKELFFGRAKSLLGRGKRSQIELIAHLRDHIPAEIVRAILDAKAPAR
jgi:hypothetical protein